MKAIALFLMLAISCHASDYTEIHGDGHYSEDQNYQARIGARRIGRDFERRKFRAMAEHGNRALSAIFKIGTLNLDRKGFHKEAEDLRNGWKQYDGELQRIVAKRNRDIGDFEPISKYLAAAYEILEYKLGYQLCYTLRLSDLKSLNYGLKEVFNPCPHTEKDFEDHFVHDAKYRGVAPVVTYWATIITCSIATYGAGYFFVCSPIGMATEWLMDKKIAPKIAPKIYSWACNKEEE